MLKRIKITFWPVLVTLTAFILLCKLGFWQLQRADEKREWLLSFGSEQTATQDDLFNAIDPASGKLLNGQNVVITGQVQSQFMMLLDNRVHQGQTGYKVLAPVFSTKFKQSILVDFGWLKAPTNRSELPTFSLPEEVELHGVIKSTQLQQFVLENTPLIDEWPQRIQSINMVFEHNWQPKMVPLIVYANNKQVEGLVQTYKPVVMMPEKHEAYAVQWFLLAFASLVIFVFASRVKPASQDPM